jgi:hypothetical protein
MTQAPDAPSGVSNRSPALEFLAALFNGTAEESEGGVYLSSLPNLRDDPLEQIGERHVCAPSADVVDKFVRKWDRTRRGLFVCVGTVADNKRNKDNIRETVCLHADVDFKELAEDEPTIRAALDTLPSPPSIVIRSGNGLHLYWLFREPIDTQRLLARLEEALRRLAAVVGGDPAVCEVSRLMRLPGTHNTKRGDWREVVIERMDAERRYELEDLEDWLDEQRPVLVRKSTNGTGQVDAGSYPSDDNPYLRHAREWGYKPRLDVEAALAAMHEGNIHTTLRDVAASLIHIGQPLEEVVGILMEAARKVGGPDWNWRSEDNKIRQLCESALKKFPPKEQIVSRETAVEPDDGNVVDLGEARAKTKRKPRSPSVLLAPFAVADGVIETVRRHGGDILLSEGEVWLYGEGFWRIMTPADRQWLATMIQQGFEEIKEPGKTSSLTSAWKRICEHPRLFKAKVPWAGGGTIVCRNGVIVADDRSPDGWRFEIHKPENYARRYVGADFDPGAECPQFVALIASMFSDRPDAHLVIPLLQEWLGGALAIATLKREQRRALIPVGGSRTGKTELTMMIRALLGGPIATPSAKEFGERFGLETLYGAAAWIRDDAINEGDRLDPQRFKTVVTGEPVDIDRKNQPAVRDVRLDIPVCLNANGLARIRDNSDAVFNRSIVLNMTNAISLEAAHAARVAAGTGEQSIGMAIFEREAAGILNWALAGLVRLRKRGFYHIPESIETALTQYRDANNPVAEWAREALAADPDSRVARSDLVRAYNGWELEQEGEEARAHGARWLLPRLRNQIKGMGEYQNHKGVRYVAGAKLTELGLAMWTSYGLANSRTGPGGFSTSASEVNRPHERGQK